MQVQGSLPDNYVRIQKGNYSGQIANCIYLLQHTIDFHTEVERRDNEWRKKIQKETPCTFLNTKIVVKHTFFQSMQLWLSTLHDTPVCLPLALPLLYIDRKKVGGCYWKRFFKKNDAVEVSEDKWLTAQQKKDKELWIRYNLIMLLQGLKKNQQNMKKITSYYDNHDR